MCEERILFEVDDSSVTLGERGIPTQLPKIAFPKCSAHIITCNQSSKVKELRKRDH